MMTEVETEFWATWNAQLRATIVAPADFDISRHANVFGGFTLTTNQYATMDSGLRCFFDSRVARRGDSVILRGHDYYACDPQLYPASRRPRDATLWRLFRDKWRGYWDRPTFSFLETGPVHATDWIGALSYAEYLANDLTTLRWFVWRNRGAIVQQLGQTAYGDIRDAVAVGARDVAAAIAGMLVGSPSTTARLLNAAGSVCSSDQVSTFLERSVSLGSAGNGDVRAIREGDSLPLIYAAYSMKLRPFAASGGRSEVSLLSNAFGALNVAEVLAALIRSELGVAAAASDIQFSQHRATGDLFATSAGGVTLLDPDGMASAPPVNDLVLVDDSVFTGTSYEQIQSALSDRFDRIHFLPLAVDLPSIRHYNREQRDVASVLARAKQCVAWSSELGGRPPAFQAFWDWSEATRHVSTSIDPDVRAVMNGGDLLLKELWTRYSQGGLSS